MIHESFELMRQTRTNFLQITRDLTLDQLNQVPAGFRNNLVWNFGHMVVTLPLLTYGLSGLPLPVDAGLVAMYRRGTRPEGPVSSEHWQLLHDESEQTLNQVRSDYDSGIFQEWKSYTTTYGYTLDSVADALRFAPVHEGLHLGYAMALLKSVI